MIGIAKVAAIATAMAIIGTLLLSAVTANHSEFLRGFLPRVILASTLFWVAASMILRLRRVPLRGALLLGAVSPWLGGILLGILFPFGVHPKAPSSVAFGDIVLNLVFVTATSWICVPVGVLTAFLIAKAQTPEARPA